MSGFAIRGCCWKCASRHTDLLSTQAYTVYTRLRVNTNTSQTRKKKIQLGLEKSNCSSVAHRCWRCRSHSGRVTVVAIAAAVGEALPAVDAALFPAEGATGLALNSQMWLREPRLKSPRHCSPGQRLK